MTSRFRSLTLQTRTSSHHSPETSSHRSVAHIALRVAHIALSLTSLRTSEVIGFVPGRGTVSSNALCYGSASPLKAVHGWSFTAAVPEPEVQLSKVMLTCSAAEYSEVAESWQRHWGIILSSRSLLFEATSLRA
eukprot:767311-Hanusia_phi.AAC.6